MKIIFLDIDGVLNSGNYMSALNYNYRSEVHKGIKEYPIPIGVTRDEYGQYFDDSCVMNLESIINYTGANIVISSTWRKTKGGIEKLRNMWQYRDLPGKIVGVTGILNQRRGHEIKAYLDAHDDIESYVIIDDDSDMLWEQQNNFVKTDGFQGLTQRDALKAVEILNGKQ